MQKERERERGLAASEGQKREDVKGREKGKGQDLAEAVRAPGFTPGVRHISGLIELLATADDDLARDIERALARTGDPGAPRLVERAASASPPLRERLCRALGRLAPQSDAARAYLLRTLEDEDPKTRRNAVIALGKLKGDDIEAGLLAAWERETRPEHRRSLAASLGKVGGEKAAERLAAADAAGTTNDPELRRIVDRARLMVDRTARREETSRIDADKVPAAPVTVAFRCRAGLQSILASELDPSFSPRPDVPGRVLATLRGPLHTLFAARTAIDFAFPLPEEHLREHEDEGDAIIRALTSPEARIIFSTWTVGYARFRLAWADGGHKRAVTWRIAKEVAERTASEAWLDGGNAGEAGRGPTLVNDPTASTWEARVEVMPKSVRVELTPRLDDPRFVYRTRDVPGASHPPLAAALARVGEARADDVVWDPFAGAGTELVERALLGPYHEIYGSDLDAGAISAARANVRAAGVERVTLAVADALAWAPRGVSLIITNPPMGRRVTRTADLTPMLEKFMEHAARVLPPGGRLVWVSPFPERTTAVAIQSGLELQFSQAVDMGGFRAEIQRFVRGTAGPRKVRDRGPKEGARPARTASPKAPERPKAGRPAPKAPPTRRKFSRD